MRALNRLLSRIFNFVFARRGDERLREEMESHLALLAEEKARAGMPSAEARRQARVQLGGADAIREQFHTEEGLPFLENCLRDLRYALRQLRKSPGFTITAVLTLALGIAVNGTIFSLVSAWLMPDLPEHDAGKVVVVSSVSPNNNENSDVHNVSAPTFNTIRTDMHVFAESAALLDGIQGSVAAPNDQPEAIQYAAITPNYFSIFGAAPQLGRGFLPGEDQPGRDHIVVLSHGLWARKFASDPAVVGKTIRLNREDYTVVGVMGSDFRLMWLTTQLWTPMTLKGTDLAPDARRNRNLIVFAQVAPGVTLPQAAAEARRLADRAATDFPDVEGRWGGSVHTLKDYLVRSFDIAPSLLVMMTAVGFVLLIACTNVSGLLLTRAAARQKELAIRASLGATRARILRQLLIEGLTLACVGGAAGIAFAWVGIRLMRSLLTFNEGIAAVPFGLDAKVLGFSVSLTVLSALLSSIAPAWRGSRANPGTDLKNEGRSATAGRGRNRFRAVLVGIEIAMALFLLTGVGLLVRGIYALNHQQLGFRTDHLLTAGLVLDAKKYPDAPAQLRFVRDLLTPLHEISGVEDAAVTVNLPSTGAGHFPLHIQGIADPAPIQLPSTEHVAVTPEFFSAAGIALMRGRTFTGHDDGNAPRVVVVNQKFAEHFLGSGEAVGRLLKLDIPGETPPWELIVGVVSNVKSYSEETRVDPMVYEAFAQRPSGGFSIMIRSAAEPDGLVPVLRRVVTALDPDLPLLNVMNMEKVIQLQHNGDPVFEEILTTFAVLALGLAAVGIYGLIAYSVRQRTQEFGIRLALGAKQSDIAGMILREGLKITSLAAAFGLLLALPLGRLFDSMFPGIEFVAPAVYPAVLAATILVALAATYGPARRAMKIDPTTALRNE
jgi:predicted permease